MFIRISFAILFATWMTGCYLSHEREENSEPVAPLCGHEYDPTACGPHPDGPDNYFDFWAEPDDPLETEDEYRIHTTSSVAGTVAYGGRIRAFIGSGGNARVINGEVRDVLSHVCVLEWLECRQAADMDISVLYAFQIDVGESIGFILETDFAERSADEFIGYTEAVGQETDAACNDASRLTNIVVQHCEHARCLPVEIQLVSASLRLDGVVRNICLLHVRDTPVF